jgi:transposase
METKIRRQYTADYKAQAVLLVESLGLAGGARKLGMSVKTLANWVRLERSGTPVSSSKRRSVSDIEAENSRLRAENATLRMEREVLKKATAFFAKESR